MLTGQDVIGQAQTGTGKTAAFALPLLHRLQPEQPGVQGLILAPTRELALQVAQAIRGYGKHLGARVATVYGGQSYSLQINQLRRGVHIVVGTPGRLIDLMDKGLLDLSQARCVVLDEADEMLSMGFVEDIQKILAATPADRQTALFSATLPFEIRKLADQYMHSPQFIAVQAEAVTVAAIEQRFYAVNEPDKAAVLARLFELEEVTRSLIFVRTRAATGELANELTRRGFAAEALNGDLTQEARERTLNRFRQNQLKVLVATDVAARGLDIEAISHVFNMHLPEDPEIYVHRIGRTGRAGKTGVAISLVSPYERRRLRQVEDFTRQRLARAEVPTEEDIRARREERLLAQVVIWLKRGRTRRERELVETLVSQGYDPLEVAAAALKVARADEKQRPIAAVSEVEFKPAYDRGMRSRSGARLQSEAAVVSHEPGMVRLTLKMGKAHGLRPNEVVGTLAAVADIPGSRIGKIQIGDRQSHVDVPEELVAKVLSKARQAQIRRQPLDLQMA
jgi:ATP-dependent RNA helicase DeaD